MKKLLPLFALFFPLLLPAQGHEERLAQIDVQHYHFSIELSADSDEIQGDAWLTVKFLKPSQYFVLDFLEVGENGKGMEVKGVFEIRKPLELPMEYMHKEKDLGIMLPTTGAKAGEVKTFRISYAGIPADGLIISKNRHGHRTFFGDNWPNRAHNWLPTVDHPSDKATVTWEVKVPAGFECVANGKLMKLSPGESPIYRYECKVPLPTKVMVIGVADFAIEDLPPVEGIPLSSWVFPEDSSQGFDHYDDAAPILKAFMDSIAPYAYEKLANVQSKTRYGGMENASSIFYYESSVDEEIVPLLAHEIAHQWFGNMATEANWHHIWLSEGFATYFTDLYIEWSSGNAALMGRMERERDKVIRFNQKAQRPVVDTEVTDWNRLLNPNSYEKGAWVLHMLRQEIGYTAFMKGVRAYYGQYGGKNALTADLQAVMEEVSGQDLAWFFEQWIYQGGHPELEVRWKAAKGGKKIEVEVKQVQKGSLFRFDLEFKFPGKYEGNPFRSLRVAEKVTKATFDLDGRAIDCIADPNVRLLADIKVMD